MSPCNYDFEVYFFIFPDKPHKPGITSKTETQHQGFESYIITNVCESCPFEIEAYSAFRAIFRLFKPKKFSIRVDKTLYEPGARQPVDPGMSASCPKAPIIGSKGEAGEKKEVHPVLSSSSWLST